MNGLRLLKKAGWETDTSLAEEVLTNIRGVEPFTLKRLKQELKGFNAKTMRWTSESEGD